MSQFEVRPTALHRYAGSMQHYADDEVRGAGPFCRRYAGQTGGLHGVLGELAGPLTALAGGFADHYDTLATMWVTTGQQLSSTAADYRRADDDSSARLDRSYPGGVGVHDAEADGEASLPGLDYSGWHGRGPASDPAAAIRDGMSLDAKIVDVVFHRITHHHITDPLDAMVGNWDTLRAAADAWRTLRGRWLGFGSTMSDYASGIDHLWDGHAASAFQTWARRFAGAMQGEGEICGGVALVLDRLADEFERRYTQAVGLIQDVIHKLESAGVTAALPYIGEVQIAKKVQESVTTFAKAVGLAEDVTQLVARTRATIDGFHRLVAAVDLVATAPARVTAAVGGVAHLVGAAPAVTSHLSHLRYEPHLAYGGPSAPHFSNSHA